MDKQEYLTKIAEAAFNDELEKIGFSVKGMPKAALSGLRRGMGTLGQSFQNLAAGVAMTARDTAGGLATTAKSSFRGGVRQTARNLGAGISMTAKDFGAGVGLTAANSKAALGTIGGVGLAGGGAAYAMNRKKK